MLSDLTTKQKEKRYNKFSGSYGYIYYIVFDDAYVYTYV